VLTAHSHNALSHCISAIAELGDPMVLAARYSGRPLRLIGPALYPDWKRAVIALELVVVPIVLVVIALVWLIKGEPVGEAVGASLWISFEVAIQLAFWITVAFAAIERSPKMRRTSLMPWTPELLPDTSTEPTAKGVLFVAAYSAAFIAVFVVSWFVSPFTDASGAPITFFDPWIVQTGLAIVLVAVPLLQICGAALQLCGHGNLATAIAAIVVDAAGAVTVIVLGATSHVLNPAFLRAAGWADAVEPIVNYTLIGVGVLAIIVSVWENLRSARRV